MIPEGVGVFARDVAAVFLLFAAFGGGAVFGGHEDVGDEDFREWAVNHVTAAGATIAFDEVVLAKTGYELF